MKELNTLVEDLTYYFHWSPRDCDDLTPTELIGWRDAANRITEIQQDAQNGRTSGESDEQRNVRVAMAALADQKRAR